MEQATWLYEIRLAIERRQRGRGEGVAPPSPSALSKAELDLLAIGSAGAGASAEQQLDSERLRLAVTKVDKAGWLRVADPVAPEEVRGALRLLCRLAAHA
jgi:hypothetical protein